MCQMANAIMPKLFASEVVEEITGQTYLAGGCYAV